MGQPQYLIDTNSVIDYLGEKLPAPGMKFMNDVVDAVPMVSIITKIEVLGFNAPAKHYQLLKDFVSDATLFTLTDAIVDASIEVRKKHKIKLPDAIIAATALVHNFKVISRNTKDFQGIEGLECLNPYDFE